MTSLVIHSGILSQTAGFRGRVHRRVYSFGPIAGIDQGTATQIRVGLPDGAAVEGTGQQARLILAGVIPTALSAMAVVHRTSLGLDGFRFLPPARSDSEGGAA